MKKIFWTVLLCVCIGVILVMIFERQNNSEIQVEPFMTFSSTAFANNTFIPSNFTCDGSNERPELSWGNLPEGTKSLAIIVDDPDAPNGDFVHWIIWNIDPLKQTNISKEVPNEAIEGITGFGKSGWGGPCPSAGVHRYFFKLYALDDVLDLESKTTKVDLEGAIQGHILGETSFIGLYEKIK